MKIPLRTDITMFYRVLLTLMNKFPPIRGLRAKETDVLAEIMLQNYNNRIVEDYNKRQILVFSTDSRSLMAKNLEMKAANFNNYIKVLKKQKLITRDNKLIKFLADIMPEKEYSLDFKFMIV